MIFFKISNTIGTLQVYCLVQFSYWLLCYAAVVYWSLNFPFSYEQAKNSGKLKYVFVITVFISITFPLLALILAVDGFYSTNIVFSACSARNPLHFYLVSTLHLSLVMYICSVLLFLDIQVLCNVRCQSSYICSYMLYQFLSLSLSPSLSLFFSSPPSPPTPPIM